MISLSREEALVLDSLLDSLDGHNPLKDNLKRKLESQYDLDGQVHPVTNKLLAIHIHSLSEAIRRKRKVLLKGYRSSSSGSVRDYEVEPFAFTDSYDRIWCFDVSEEQNKLFAVARIQEVELEDAAWTFEKSHQKAFRDVFGFTGFERHRVCLKLGTLSRNLLQEEYPRAMADLRLMADGAWVLDTQVASYVGVGRFVMGLLDDIRILETPGLVRYIRSYQKEHPV